MFLMICISLLRIPKKAFLHLLFYRTVQHNDNLGLEEDSFMTKQDDTYQLETLLLHGGHNPDPTTGSRAVPIYQTTSYTFHNTQHAKELFALEESGNIYSRIGNPTVDVLEKRIALLEDGVAAVATSSGQAAISLAIMNICQAGDEVIAASNLYGGTYNLFSTTLPKYGIHVKFVDPTDPNNFREAIGDKTKAIFAEIIGNPSLQLLDVEKVADIAHESGIPLIVDNTFASPASCRPITHGADVVVHSATKWLGGHGTSIAGVIVDGGRFDWNTEKFPGFTEPDSSYHGVIYAKDFGTLAFSMKVRVQLLRDFGPALSPFNAFMILQGVETLHLRIKAHNENALKIAEFLEDHPGVEWVAYPGLKSHPSYALAQKYLQHGTGSIVNFGIKEGLKAGEVFIDNISLWSHLANVGDAKSLVIHPASTTHQQLSEEQRITSGVTEDLIRLSVGIEHIDDLIKSLDKALYIATGFSKAEGGQPEVVVNDEGVISRLLKTASHKDLDTGKVRQKSIAVVGLSSNPARPSFRVSRKMQRLGYKIIPVNPRETEVLGEKAYPDLKSIPKGVALDVVQVFRSAEAAIGIAEEAAQVQPGIFWLQEGVIAPDAADIAKHAGLEVVHNRCTYKEAQRLRGTIATFAADGAPVQDDND